MLTFRCPIYLSLCTFSGHVCRWDLLWVEQTESLQSLKVAPDLAQKVVSFPCSRAMLHLPCCIFFPPWRAGTLDFRSSLSLVLMQTSQVPKALPSPLDQLLLLCWSSGFRLLWNFCPLLHNFQSRAMRISPEYTGIMKYVSGHIRKLEAWSHRMGERRTIADPGFRVFPQD